MIITAAPLPQNGAVGIYRVVGQNDEASTSLAYSRQFRQGLCEVYNTSEFWKNKLRMQSLRQKLHSTANLPDNWNTYGSEPPNELARNLASGVLKSLETGLLPPTTLSASAEGGIAFAFVNGEKRALLETYNTGEIVAATYNATAEPEVWELQSDERDIRAAIDQIRVHLSA